MSTGLVAAVLVAALAAALAWLLRREICSKHAGLWLPGYLRQDWRAEVPPSTTRHLMFCFVDHFEPQFERPAYAVECARVARWLEGYPQLCAGHRDADGRPPVHTFFYPEEEYRAEHLDSLVDLCRQGLGEIEVHLHHHDDTEAGLREKLRRFMQALVVRHDCLPLDPASGLPRFGFIHGNWALDNSRADGQWCGVNNEIRILKEEGCYADFTLPAAPDSSQTRTINRIYYATDDVARPRSHDRGVRVRVGTPASGDLMIVQGPLGLLWHDRKYGLIPRTDSGDIRTSSPPTPERIDGWVRTGIHVEGRPEWIFVKVHTHGAPERDVNTLLGPAMSAAFSHLESRYNDGKAWQLHYVSARETYNIIKAAEAGCTGNPNQYRDYELARPDYRRAPVRDGEQAHAVG